MEQLRQRLSYANVMSSIAVFLVLGGASAVAAKKIGSNQLRANSVGTSKIKRNAVTTTKIRKNAITRAKIKNDAVDGTKIANGSVTGADINASSTSFSQVVARVRTTGSASFPDAFLFSNPTYTQNAGEDNQFVGAVDVTFGAGCEAPRAAQALLLLDAATPGVAVSDSEVAGTAFVEDKGSGAVTKRGEFVESVGGGGMSRFAPSAATQHTFSVDLVAAICKSGSGVTATAAGVDVIGTK